MARYERVADIYGVLSAAERPMSLDELCQALDASTATVKRLVRFMREDLNVAVDFDRAAGGYRIDPHAVLPLPVAGAAEPAPALPVSEEAALNAAACELLEGLAPDLLAAQLVRLRERLAPPASASRAAPVASPRVKVLLPQQRPVDARRFRTVIGALCATRRLKVRYRCRSRSGETEHVISPQRVVFHRSNWYLAAWCHAAKELRVFSIDRIEFAEALDEAADVIDTKQLEATLEGGYGLAPGEARAMAVLRFTPAAARWVAEEQWHPQQRVDRLGDGSVTLHVPYGDPAELRGEILRWGSEVEVVSPPELRADLGATLERAAALYG